MRNHPKEIFLDSGKPSFSSASSSLSSADLLFINKSTNSLTLPKIIMTRTNTSLMNLINKVMRSQKLMILFYSILPELFVLMDLLGHIMSQKLVILLASFFTFKAEDGVMDLMNRKLFRNATKGQKCGLELLRNIIHQQ